MMLVLHFRVQAETKISDRDLYCIHACNSLQTVTVCVEMKAWLR